MYSIQIRGYEGDDFATFDSCPTREEAERRANQIQADFASADDPLADEDIRVVEETAIEDGDLTGAKKKPEEEQ